MNPFEGFRITSPFGYRTHPIKKTREFHCGIDLVKPHQSPIYSFTDGEVLFVGEGKNGSGVYGMGNIVAVKDIKGHLHVYAHLDSTYVKVGAKVTKGQMIGRQGTTGMSTGSHLHYEVRKKFSPQLGFSKDRENQCFEPTKYLQDFYKEDEKMPEKEENKIVAGKCKIKVHGKATYEGVLIDGSSYIKVKDAFKGDQILWNPTTHTVEVKCQ